MEILKLVTTTKKKNKPAFTKKKKPATKKKKPATKEKKPATTTDSATHHHQPLLKQGTWNLTCHQRILPLFWKK